MSQMKAPIISILVTFLLSSCSHWGSTTDTKRVICNKLKSDIVFNGATANSRQADIQRAEEPLQQRTYDANCDD